MILDDYQDTELEQNYNGSTQYGTLHLGIDYRNSTT